MTVMWPRARSRKSFRIGRGICCMAQTFRVKAGCLCVVHGPGLLLCVRVVRYMHAPEGCLARLAVSRQHLFDVWLPCSRQHVHNLEGQLTEQGTVPGHIYADGRFISSRDSDIISQVMAFLDTSISGGLPFGIHKLSLH